MPGSRLFLQERPLNLDDIVKKIEGLATLPQVALHVLKVVNDPQAGAGDLKAVMESDLSLCARVLRSANSSAYALRIKITNLQQAIAYLGLKQVRSLALAANVSSMFQPDAYAGSYRTNDLWRHSVAVGITARLLGIRLNVPNYEDLFLAGLLHDIGILLENEYVNARFCRVMESLDPARTLCENENNHLGFDHTQLGARIAAKWGLPTSVQTAIAHHHSSSHMTGGTIEMVQYIEVANVLCTFKGISSVGVNLVRACPALIAGMSLTKEDLLAIAEQLDHELAENSALLALTKDPGERDD